MTTLDDFFGIEDNRIDLGNSLVEELENRGFSFQESRSILRGEIEAPVDLAQDVASLIEMESEHQKDLDYADSLSSLRPSPPAYGDYEGTGWMDSNS